MSASTAYPRLSSASPPPPKDGADLEVRPHLYFRVPLDLLDDCSHRGLSLQQLRDLVRLWVLERPNDPVPKTIDPLVELLVR